MVIKSKRKRLMGHVACMVKMRNAEIKCYAGILKQSGSRIA
jgi:hypothetical protein